MTAFGAILTHLNAGTRMKDLSSKSIVLRTEPDVLKRLFSKCSHGMFGIFIELAQPFMNRSGEVGDVLVERHVLLGGRPGQGHVHAAVPEHPQPLRLRAERLGLQRPLP